MVDHVLHATLASSHELSHCTQELFWNIDGEIFNRLVNLAVDLLGNYLRLTNGKFVAFATHQLNQDGKSKLPATLNFPGVRTLGWKHLDRHVTD